MQLKTVLIFLALCSVCLGLNKTQDPYDVDKRWGQKTDIDCYKQCHDNQACLKDCLSNRLVIGVSVGAVFLVIFVVIFVCMCYKKGWCLKVRCCGKFYGIAKNYNIVDAGALSAQQFKAIKDKIIDNINLSSHIPNHNHRILKSTYRIKAHITGQKQQKPFRTAISIKGTDHLDKFWAQGYILAKNQGQVFIWFYKVYNNREKNGQIGEFQHLIYEGVSDQDGGVIGRWFYYDLQDSDVGGRWCLYAPTQMVGIQDKIAEQYIVGAQTSAKTLSKQQI